MAVLAMLLGGCAGSEGSGGSGGSAGQPDQVTPASVPPTSSVPWKDVTKKYKDASLGNVTIKDNDQWEPFIGHVVKVQYNQASHAYRLYMDLSSDDLRRQLPGIMMTPGIGACMTVQFWDNKPDGIAVYGSDGKKSTEATGSPGICQDV